MAKQYMSMRNLRFLLHEVFKVEELVKHPIYQDHSKETFDMMLDTAKQISDTLLHPIYEEMDKNKPELGDNVIHVHPQVRAIMKEFGDGGWIAAPEDYEHGGQKMPAVLYNSCNFIFHSANTAAASYPGLTTGAADLILTYGSDELKETYLSKMYAGEWQGTMALTEPHAGSSLGDITTSAEPQDDGTYLIKGQKIFISAGDHDGVENVIHLMLAKIPGGPPGTKGISLFVVPKKRLENVELVPNDIQTAGFEAKMGMKGCPIAHLIMGEKGNCKGYLVGQPHEGIRYMFQMMNGARLSVGMMSTGLASAAYYASLEYAHERPQGRKVNVRDMTTSPSLIIEYADVKRMLLFQKSIVEGCLAFVTQCAHYADMIRISEGEEQEKYQLLLDLLTPIAKSYPAEMSVQSTSAGVQVLGGAGYCADFPLQQFFRDTRINPIYEGTTGIQAMDLLGRKVPAKMGKSLMLYAAEINDTISKAKGNDTLKPYAEKLEAVLQKFSEITMKLMGLAQSADPEVFLADATLYLEAAGIMSIGWQWLKQAVVVQEKLAENPQGEELNFYQGKMAAFKFFYSYELPKTRGLIERLNSDERLTLELDKAYLV